MWILYALAASAIWGARHAASGRVIARGMTPLTFFYSCALFGAIAGAIVLAVAAKAGNPLANLRGLGPDWRWLAVALVSPAAGTPVIYIAIARALKRRT